MPELLRRPSILGVMQMNATRLGAVPVHPQDCDTVINGVRAYELTRVADTGDLAVGVNTEIVP